jgi:hypothetical protein
MTKTPEELAEDYVQSWWGPREDNMTIATRQSFLAGYSAGHLAGVVFCLEMQEAVVEYNAKLMMSATATKEEA